MVSLSEKNFKIGIVVILVAVFSYGYINQNDKSSEEISANNPDKQKEVVSESTSNSKDTPQELVNIKNNNSLNKKSKNTRSPRGFLRIPNNQDLEDIENLDEESDPATYNPTRDKFRLINPDPEVAARTQPLKPKREMPETENFQKLEIGSISKGSIDESQRERREDYFNRLSQQLKELQGEPIDEAPQNTNPTPAQQERVIKEPIDNFGAESKEFINESEPMQIENAINQQELNTEPQNNGLTDEEALEIEALMHLYDE